MTSTNSSNSDNFIKQSEKVGTTLMAQQEGTGRTPVNSQESGSGLEATHGGPAMIPENPQINDGRTSRDSQDDSRVSLHPSIEDGVVRESSNSNLDSNGEVVEEKHVCNSSKLHEDHSNSNAAGISNEDDSNDLDSTCSGEITDEELTEVVLSSDGCESKDMDHSDTTPSNDDSPLVSASTSDSKPPLTRHQKLVLLSLSLTCILDNASFSILLPFFPIEAEKIGVSSTVTGLIFGIYELVTFIASPICGKYLPIIGAKFMYLSGLFIAGGCNLLFGFLPRLQSKTEFIAYCFVIRCIEAVGAAAGLTALYTIVARTCPNRVSQTIGWIETMSGIGFMLGPPIGGALYQLGGYPLPFLCLGICTILGVACNIFLLPTVGRPENESGSITDVLRVYPVWPTLIALIVSSMGVGFLDPTLAPHLTHYHLKPWAVGLFFLLSGGFYAASSPVFGSIADKRDVTRIMMVLGFCVCGVGYLLVGPSQLLNLPDQPWIVGIGLATLGVGWGASQVPVFQDMLVSATWYGLPDNTQTHGVISGLYMSVYSLGCFAGPSLAGIMIDTFGFQLSSTMFAGAMFVSAIGLGLFSSWEFQFGIGRRRPHRQRIQEEDTAALIDNDVAGSINSHNNCLQNPVA